MKHYSSKDIDIIPPSRPVSAITRSSATPVVVSPRPYDQNPGGIVSGVPKRWLADSQTRTLDAFTRRDVAARKFIEADTALQKSWIENCSVRQQVAELPQQLAAESTMRAMRRSEEIRDLAHQIDLADRRRAQEIARAELDAYPTRVALMDAEQKLRAQREYGPRYQALEWEQRINERELYVAEQRLALAAHPDRADADAITLEDLEERRRQINTDGGDTTEIDRAIERKVVQQRQGRR